MISLKKSLLLSALLVVIVVFGVVVYKGIFSTKVTYINIPKLMHKYEAMKVVKGKIDQKSLEYKANVDSLKADFERLVKKHEFEKAGMSKREEELSVQLLNRKGADLQRYEQATQQKLEQEDAQLRETELKVVNDFIHEYSKEKGYDYVLAANDAGVLIYAKDKLDITDDILEKLNEKYTSVK